MKMLNDYMEMSYRMEIVEDSGFVVSYSDLPGCITCGETVEKSVIGRTFQKGRNQHESVLCVSSFKK